MKTRVKNKFSYLRYPTGHRKHYDLNGVVTYDYDIGNTLHDTSIERISYAERAFREDKTTNDCVHYVHKETSNPFCGVVHDSFGGYEIVTNWNLTEGNVLDLIERTYFDIPEGFNARAFEAMKPKLESSLSLSNFIVELTDVKHILTLFTKWSGLSKKIAEGHLSYAFGYKPFVSDVKKIYKILTDHQEIIQNFLDRRFISQRTHYVERSEPVKNEDANYVMVAPYIGYKRITTESMVCHASMQYSYSCPEINNFQDKLSALRDMLGLRLTASVIWEAIPYSFVVDWFFRVQEFLESYEDPLIPVVITVEDYSISFKTEWFATLSWKYWAAPGGATWGYWPNEWTDSGKTYIRRRTLPDDAGNTFINRGQYGRNQLALSASLLITKKR